MNIEQSSKDIAKALSVLRQLAEAMEHYGELSTRDEVKGCYQWCAQSVRDALNGDKVWLLSSTVAELYREKEEANR